MVEMMLTPQDLKMGAPYPDKASARVYVNLDQVAENYRSILAFVNRSG